MSEILRAAIYAEQKHAGQKRKDGKPYFTHVLRMFLAHWMILLSQSQNSQLLFQKRMKKSSIMTL